MKNINLLTAILTTGFLLSGCGDSSSNTRRTVTTPGYQKNYSSKTVRLKATDKGNISYIDFSVVLPSNTKESLLHYNGEATIKGTIESTTFPCLKGRKSFSCKARLSVGTITAGNCSISNYSISLEIIVLPRKELKQTYIVDSIRSNASQNCYFQQN